MRTMSRVAPGWWDYTTLDKALLDEAASLTEKDIAGLARGGFAIRFYDTLEEFYLAEALEYITAWRRQRKSARRASVAPSARRSNSPWWPAWSTNWASLSQHATSGAWTSGCRRQGGSADFPLGFARADMELCFNRIRPELRMPRENIHFPAADPTEYIRSWDAGALRGHAGRPGRGQALGLQRPAEARRADT